MHNKNNINDVLNAFTIFQKNIKEILHKNQDICTNTNDTLSMNQHMCLNIIYLDNVNSMSEISKKMGISNQQTTRVVDDLVKKGYIIRQRNENNHRQILAITTPKADELYKKIFDSLARKLGMAFEGVDDEKIEQLLNAVNTANEILDQVNKK